VLLFGLRRTFHGADGVTDAVRFRGLGRRTFVVGRSLTSDSESSRFVATSWVLESFVERSCSRGHGLCVHAWTPND